MKVDIGSIRLDGNTQPRFAMDWVTVSEYAERMVAGDPFPPIVVFFDGVFHWLADGFHRVKAAEQIGAAQIDADIQPGTLEDAQWYSFGANKSHGLRRSNEDKRQAVERALAHPKAASMTDVAIAQHCGVSSHTIGNYRKTIIENFNDSFARTVTRNGTTYLMNTKRIGDRVEHVDLEPGLYDDEEDEEQADGCGNCKHYHYDMQGGWYCSAMSRSFSDDTDCPCNMKRWEPESEPEPEPEPESHTMAHVGQNSGNNEWYTPSEYIEAARDVMGAIDLDPASSEVANAIVGAAKFYTADDNGLLYDWRGKVWMNPPYAQPAIADFCAKMREEFIAERVTEAIVLVNNATETAWFQSLISAATAVCFPLARIRFWSPDRTSATPLQGQAVVYLGANFDAFIARFMAFGWCAEVA